MAPCHNGSVRRAGMAIGRRAQQRFAYTPQPHPPIRYNIRGIGGWGWGVWDGLPMVSRVSLEGLAMRDMDWRGWGVWGWVANGYSRVSL